MPAACLLLVETDQTPPQALSTLRSPPPTHQLSSMHGYNSFLWLYSKAWWSLYLEESSRKWGHHLCGERLICSVGAGQGFPASLRAALSWTCAPSSSVPVPPMLCAGGTCSLCRAASCILGLNSLFQRGWGGHTEDNSPCHLFATQP